MSTLTLYTRPVRRHWASYPAVPQTRVFVPAAELVRDGSDAVLTLETPGLDPAKDLTVEVTGRRLVVKGERRSRAENGLLREVRYGRFERAFGLPQSVTADAVTATYDAGVLTVRVAGAYPAAPQTVTVPVSVATPQPVAVGDGTEPTEATEPGTPAEA